jgi:hypothetical protein
MNYKWANEGEIMQLKHLEMLGDAVRRERNSQLSSVELGKLIMQYVELLHKEGERDAREEVNRKGENK